MFTGIIETQGTVTLLEKRGGDARLGIEAPAIDWSSVAVGDSIATNGVCLTAIEINAQGYFADVSAETLSLTTIGTWKSGTRVNLERALTPSSRLGGHIVSGHVDGIGEVLTRTSDARSERFLIRAPANLAKYVAHKGSITIDGTSLTVNQINGNEFDINIVPHTLQVTIIGGYQPGTKVNLEVDVLARYLERLMLGESAADKNASN